MTRRARRPVEGTGLLFSVAELVREVEILKKVAAGFLDRATVWELDEYRNGLSEAARQGSGFSRLELRGVETLPSQGAYEPDRKGGHSVHGRVSGVWEVRPYELEGRKKKKGAQGKVEFCGIASTKIELWEDDRRLAMWRCEFGDGVGPGCYFHVQVLGDGLDLPFPKTLPVPRLPSLFVTPMAAIEYVLGELFQGEWGKEMGAALFRRRPKQFCGGGKQGFLRVLGPVEVW